MEEKIIISMIRHYLNVSKDKWSNERIKEEYPEAITIALDNYKKVIAENRPSGISSISQGSQSISYSETDINNLVVDGMVKALLPRPFLRLY